MRIALFVFLLLIAGCASNDVRTGNKPPEDELASGTCQVNLPDGSPADCLQHAMALSGQANIAGAICTEQTIPGSQGSVQLYRRPLSSLTVLQLALAQQTSGVAWLESDPFTMWFWQGADGQERWELGHIEAGDKIFIKAYSLDIQDLNARGENLLIEQRWTTVADQAYALHRIVLEDREYFLDRMVGLDRGGVVEYSLASFSQYLDQVYLQVTHTSIISTVLPIDDMPSC